MKRDESYLDRLISFIFDHVGAADAEPLDLFTAELVFADVYTCFNRARDRRGRGEKAYVTRCRTLLRVLPKVRPLLEGQLLEDCRALEEVLINVACEWDIEAPRGEPPCIQEAPEARVLPFKPKRRRKKKDE